MGIFSRRRSDSNRPLAGGTRADGIGAGWANPASGQGGALDRQVYTEYLEGCPLDPLTVNALMRNNAIARRLARRPAEESNKEGHVVRGSVSGQAINVQVGGPPVEKDEPPDPFAAWVQRFGLHGKIIEAESQAQAHGLSLWVYGLEDGRRSDEPVDLVALQRINWLRVASRAHVSVMSWGTDPWSPRFELPLVYQVTFPRSGTQALYHWTRVWAWDGIALSSDERALTHDNGGGSIFDLVWAELKNYGVAPQLAVEAITMLSQGVWTNENLARAIDGGQADEVAAHHERMRLGGGVYGDYVLDGTESYSVVGRPIAGLPEAMDRFRDAMVAASEQPEPVLLGAAHSTSGLNNETDGIIRSYLSHLYGLLPVTYTPPLRAFYQLASRANNGPTQGVPIVALDVGWPLLWQSTPMELAQVRDTNASARTKDIASQSITIEESRSDTTLSVEYTLAETVVVETETEVAAEEIELADDSLMPVGETPIGLAAAGAIIGKRSPQAILRFIKDTDTPLFRPGGRWAVYASQVRESMAGSRI